MFDQIMHTALILVSLAGLGLFLARLDRACRALSTARSNESHGRD